MKPLLFLAALVLTISAYSQPTTKQLEQAIEKIERKNYTRQGEYVTGAKITIHNYKIIPLRDWYKLLLDTHLMFSQQWDSLLTAVKSEKAGDSAWTKAFEEQLQSHKDTLSDTTSNNGKRDYVAYFKKKYDETPPSTKAYEVWYSLSLQTNKFKFYGRDSVRTVLHIEDLSEVH